jgi:predicted aspartyl protease
MLVINTLIAPAILLSALFLLSSPSSPQASSGTMSETLKVQVVSNLIVIPGYVNDSSRLDVVLDTGAGENVLMPNRASELKLGSASSGQASGIGRGQDETAIPIKLIAGIPFVEAAFETASGAKVPALFLVDSGTSVELILSRKFLDAHPSVVEGHALVNFPPVTAVGGSIGMQDLRITGLDLGPFRLTAPVAALPRDTLGALANHEIAGFIGAGILSRFTVDWDYQHETMTLLPNHSLRGPFRGPGASIGITILRSGKQSRMTIHRCRLV